MTELQTEGIPQPRWITPVPIEAVSVWPRSKHKTKHKN